MTGSLPGSTAGLRMEGAGLLLGVAEEYTFFFLNWVLVLVTIIKTLN